MRPVYRHPLVARLAHWLWALAILVLVMSGLQIFNASPQLDASDKSDPVHRVLAIGAHDSPAGPVGTLTIGSVQFVTTHLLGWTDDGNGGEAARAFPGWITLPAVQDLADGRRWHLFFAWMLIVALAGYLIGTFVRADERRALLMRRADFGKLGPMLLYYLRVRREPPPHGKYNPLQKFTYNLVLFVLLPLIILSGMALSPGIDAIAQPLLSAFGGRQFARLWHFAFMAITLAYLAVHLVLVLTSRPLANITAMITGWYRLGPHDGVGE
jgi:thiosulfate reductase cytochrome b subunit